MSAHQRLLFEDFELRLDSGELFQGGTPVKLQPQPAKVLEVLASRSGEVVSREEIRQLVWGDAFVDFDASLNFCVKEIRRALGDSATSPRFVETVPRRGYRFLMPVRTDEAAPQLPQASLPPPPAPPRRWSGLGAAAGMALCLLILLTFLLGSRLHPVPSPGKSPKARPSSETANEAYLQGIHFLEREQYDKAEASFGDVTLLDPEFAPAYAKLALAQLKREHPPHPGVTETTVRRALKLDPNLAEAHSLLGLLLFQRHLDWSGAEREIRKALELDPENAKTYLNYSLYLQALGRHEEALAAVRKARDLDPAWMVAGSNYAWYLYLDRQYEEAIRQARNILKLYPPSSSAPPSQDNNTGALICQDTILLSAWMLGDQETALAAAKAILEALGRPQEAARLRNLDEFWKGRERRIQEALRTMAVDPYYPAKNAMVMGQRDRALDLLSRCASKDILAFPFAAVEPVFDELHGDPRWSKVLDCLKLPADARAR
jgi:DNA-binding winged helix-turn-helix (wHTH) protein/Tfp pilus assembly protein PilF